MISVTDYISLIWSLELSIRLINKLNIFQEIGGQAIIGVFHIVNFLIVESKAELVALKV